MVRIERRKLVLRKSEIVSHMVRNLIEMQKRKGCSFEARLRHQIKQSINFSANIANDFLTVRAKETLANFFLKCE